MGQKGYYINTCVPLERIPDLISTDIMIRQSGLPNYLGCKILRNRICVDTWKYCLDHYWDQQIVDLLYYGFPVGFY